MVGIGWLPTNSIGSLWGYPLIITGPLGKKKRAMIFARFSTPGTFPRKLRGEFRAPFSAAGCSRFSALYLNARRISRAGGNALLKSAIFYPIFPHILPRSLPFLALAVWYASKTFSVLLRWIVLEQPEEERTNASEWRGERRIEGQQGTGMEKLFMEKGRS